MQRIYHSMVGVISLVLAVSMLALLIRFWGQSDLGTRIVLVLVCLIVPFVQPLGVFMRCVRQVKAIPKDLELKISDKMIYVTTGGKSETIPWEKIRYVMKERNMIILVTNVGSGYMLSNSVLGDERESFYEFASSCIKK